MSNPEPRIGDLTEARSSTVDLSAAMTVLSAEAAQRLLDLRRLLEAALPAVELFGDVKTMQAIRKELGL